MLRRLSVGMIALVLVGATGAAGAGSVQKKLKKLYNSLEKAFDQVEDDPNVISDPDTFANFDKLAVKYGFRVCGASD